MPKPTKTKPVIKESDKKQANIVIQIICAIGLIACVISAIFKEASISPFVYAILGGGILGTENVINLLKAVFRIGGDK